MTRRTPLALPLALVLTAAMPVLAHAGNKAQNADQTTATQSTKAVVATKQAPRRGLFAPTKRGEAIAAHRAEKKRLYENGYWDR